MGGCSASTAPASRGRRNGAHVSGGCFLKDSRLRKRALHPWEKGVEGVAMLLGFAECREGVHHAASEALTHSLTP